MVITIPHSSIIKKSATMTEITHGPYHGTNISWIKRCSMKIYDTVASFSMTSKQDPVSYRILSPGYDFFKEKDK